MELRDMLHASVAEVDRLGAKVSETRMTAAHYKLQHSMLVMETEDAAKRMEVEHDMTRRELEVLQHAENIRQAQINSDGQTEYMAELKEHCHTLDNELRLLHKRLDKAKRVIVQKEEELSATLIENAQLLKRIRENREHLSRLRSPGGIYAPTTPRTPVDPYTPQQYRGTPKHITPGSNRTHHHHHHHREGDQDTFAALLLADRVLSQENANSAPPTPRMARMQHHSHSQNLSHNRNAHSISSGPPTPNRGQAPSTTSLLPSIQFSPPNEHYRNNPPMYRHDTSPQRSRERRRKSRDSTISASDGEGRDGARAYDDMTDEEVEESQASQTATNMLRRDPRESFEVIGSPAHGSPTQATEKSNLLQTKIFGPVSKAGIEKRKRAVDEGSAEKRARTAEGVGLGIGLPSRQ
jgi:hypothetical protein